MEDSPCKADQNRFCSQILGPSDHVMVETVTVVTLEPFGKCVYPESKRYTFY